MQKDGLRTVLKFYTASSPCVRLNTQFALPLQLITHSMTFAKSIFLRGVKNSHRLDESERTGEKKKLNKILLFLSSYHHAHINILGLD